MQTYHIHIQGRVQGVGFRPYAAALAEARRLRGTVSNGMDGVHICLQTCETFAREFLDYLLAHPPQHAIITGYTLTLSGMVEESTGPDLAPPRPYGLKILDSSETEAPDLLLTPDIALCPDCRAELKETNNRRKGYAFTTCLHCGPRYSILEALPYDRPHTTMAGIGICPRCEAEYTDIHNRRHYSQTNSCPDCAIPMHWYPTQGEESPLTREGQDQDAVIAALADMLREGKIIAVKGIGGYLLLCDAGSPEVVARLRQRKHRQHKPFAVLYPNIEAAQQHLEIRPFEAEALTSPIAPIVLCSIKTDHDNKNPTPAPRNAGSDIRQPSREMRDPTSVPRNAGSEISHPTSNFLNLKSDFISPGLHRIGIMIPYTPLLEVISAAFAMPLIATSGNFSGAPIIYQDAVALADLWPVADAILTYDREILAPQDDSVWQFTESGERIILRRSRGMAPDYFPHGLGNTKETILATGADLKASFAVHHKDKIYISQYLGDLEDYRAQEAWTQSQQHLLGLLQARPVAILTDMHPGYHVHTEGQRIASELDIPIHAFQHHEAHFAAVLAENNLLFSGKPVLGMIWDGTGYGSDGQSWGGETFVFEHGKMDRVIHLDYFPQLLGDKMSREPRLSALSLLHDHFDTKKMLQGYFTETEWAYYNKALHQEQQVMTSSVGRLIDAVASVIGICQHNSYEGQAAMELEALAASAVPEDTAPYPCTIGYNRINWRLMMYMMLTDLGHQVPRATIARRFFASLARLVTEIAFRFDIPDIALSGGVFQNALLVDMIRTRLPKDMTLHTHRQLSPNDECIPLGQLALYHINPLTSHPSPNT
jgi:hydrogenase maturation protein HypF